MPPAGGVGLGVDRLAMLDHRLANHPRVDSVSLLRPEKPSIHRGRGEHREQIGREGFENSRIT